MSDPVDFAWSRTHISIGAIQTIVPECFQGYDNISIETLDQGCFSKVFAIFTDDHTPRDITQTPPAYLFRVHRPFDPFFKTASEVATTTLIGRHTNIPVPTILYYDCDANNRLGYEWSIVTYITGVPLSELFVDLPFQENLALAKEIYRYMAQLENLPSLEGIGSLYFKSDLDCTVSEVNEVVIGPVVNILPKSGDSARGPHTLKSYIHSQFDGTIARIKLEKNYFQPQEFAQIMVAASQLRRCADELLESYPGGGFTLEHADLHSGNILVDPKTKKVTGILDWDGVQNLPAFMRPLYHWFLASPEVRLGSIDEFGKHDKDGMNIYQQRHAICTILRDHIPPRDRGGREGNLLADWMDLLSKLMCFPERVLKALEIWERYKMFWMNDVPEELLKKAPAHLTRGCRDLFETRRKRIDEKNL